MGQRCMDKLSSFLFEYDTPRMVLVRNKKVGLTFRLIQLIVLAYIIGWVFLYEKGYQTQDSIVSSVSVKLKGLTMTNESTLGPHIWDVVDYVFPPQGDSSFVVMTNFIITPGQKQGTCPEVPDTGLCSQDSDCSKGTYSRQGQGIMTGKCIHFNTSVKTCEIFGWCPAEVDYPVPNPALLPEVEKFTIFIKNSITFPKFKVSRRNLVESVTMQYLKKCTYHKVTDSLCPVFDLGYLVKESGQNFSMLAVKGGVVGITIDWNCDLDWPIRYCKPIYQFHGLYNDDSNVSPGFNFRYAKYYREDGMEKRTLYKVFGIRFDILVNGKAGKFDIIPTMTTIGSGIGIFGVDGTTTSRRSSSMQNRSLRGQRRKGRSWTVHSESRHPHHQLQGSRSSARCRLTGILGTGFAGSLEQVAPAWATGDLLSLRHPRDLHQPCVGCWTCAELSCTPSLCSLEQIQIEERGWKESQ